MWNSGVKRPDADVAIVGSGLAGLAAALSLARRRVPTVLVGPRVDEATARADTRSTALFGPSLALLQRIGVLPRLSDAAVPLVGLRLIDDTGGLMRAPELLFEAREIGEAEFGVNIENAALLSACAAAVGESALIEWRGDTVADLVPGTDAVDVRLATGSTIRAKLIVGADGSRSICRSAAGIAGRTWEYPQTAIATRFAHRRPHKGVSTELHRRSGPLTTVPLAGDRSALVWVETPVEANRLMQLGEEAFARELETRLGGVLGAVSEIGPRASFPLSGVVAEPLGARRVALVGEAGHRLPPIGAQGFNLGLRDVAWLADLVADALAGGDDPGSAEVLAAYDRARRADVASRAGVVDALNRSLLADMLPVDLARGAGLVALKAVGPLRRLFMREGMGPTGPLPTLMQPLCETDDCGSALA